jgi:pimeloyl-ACP methyl ester carboxylesterase
MESLPTAMDFEVKEENYASINGIQIYYEYANCVSSQCSDLISSQKSALPILLIHGWTANRFRLHPTYIHLVQKGYPVFRLDLRGHGWSQKGLTDYSMPTMISDVDEFIRKIIVDKFGYSKMILCGHSMGGLIAQGVASNHPSYLEKLILMATSPNLFPNFYMQLGCKVFIRMWKKNYEKTMQSKKKHQIKMGLQHFPMWSDKFNTKGRTLMPDPIATTATLESMLKTDFRSNIVSLQYSTLIVVGAKDDPNIKSGMKWLHLHIPNNQYYVIPNCEHNLHIDCPNEVNKILDQFLNI